MHWTDFFYHRTGRRVDMATDKQITHYILERMHDMALDVSKLNDAVASLATAVATNTSVVDQLIATHTDPAAQAAVDAATAAVASVTGAVTAENQKVNAVLPPAPQPDQPAVA